jgi:hypothetical protein
LTWVIPPDAVDEAVGDGLAREMRLRSLPSRLGVYFVLGCALLSGDPYPQVIRQVTKGVKQALEAAGWQVPATTALTAVRRRVGERPLESVFRRVCSALSPGRAAWSHLGGLLLVAVDGTTVGVAGSGENAAAFGPVRGKGAGEQALAGKLLGSLRKGMLLLADRNFYSWALWHAAAATGADLLWRVKSSMDLTVLRELPDGSFLAHVNDPAAVHARNRRNGQRRRRGSTLPPGTGPLPGMTVRVIEFTVTVTADDGSTRAAWYRLITTLLDWRAFPFTTARDPAELTLGTAPGDLGEALAGAETEMLKALVPLRPGRIWPRAVKKPRSPYRSRGTRPGSLAQHGTCTVTVPAPRRTTENTTEQARQPAQHAGNPP